MLQTTLQQLRTWLDTDLALHLISVNLSVVQFHKVIVPELASQVLLGATCRRITLIWSSQKAWRWMIP